MVMFAVLKQEPSRLITHSLCCFFLHLFAMLPLAIFTEKYCFFLCKQSWLVLEPTSGRGRDRAESELSVSAQALRPSSFPVWLQNAQWIPKYDLPPQDSLLHSHIHTFQLPQTSTNCCIALSYQVSNVSFVLLLWYNSPHIALVVSARPWWRVPPSLGSQHDCLYHHIQTK